MIVKRLCSFTLLGLTLASCGDHKSSSSEPSETFGTVVVENASDSHENATLTFNRAECSNTVASGYFEAKLSNQSGLEAMTVRIKGFSSVSKTYNCTQAADNKTTAVGSLYDGCAIELRKKSATNPSTFSGYGIYRDDVSVKSFDYQSDCTVKVTYSPPRVDAVLSCARMIQLYYEGARRNPIDTNITASIASSSQFYCRLP